jgi:hypothetical protein
VFKEKYILLGLRFELEFAALHTNFPPTTLRSQAQYLGQKFSIIRMLENQFILRV